MEASGRYEWRMKVNSAKQRKSPKNLKSLSPTMSQNRFDLQLLPCCFASCSPWPGRISFTVVYCISLTPASGHTLLPSAAEEELPFKHHSKLLAAHIWLGVSQQIILTSSMWGGGVDLLFVDAWQLCLGSAFYHFHREASTASSFIYRSPGMAQGPIGHQIPCGCFVVWSSPTDT